MIGAEYSGNSMLYPLSLLDMSIDLALEFGADAADVVYSEHASTTVDCRNGALEKVSRSDTTRLSIRVFVGQKSATVTSSSTSSSILKELLENAVMIARHAPANADAILLQKEALAKDVRRDLDLYDSHTTSTAQLFEMASEMEDAALSVDGIEQTSLARAMAIATRTALRTTNGFAEEIGRTAFSSLCGAIACGPNNKVADHHSSTATHLADLDSPQHIGHQAATLAVSRLNGGFARTGYYPIVYAPRCASSLISAFSKAISGPAIARGMSFLQGKLGEQVFAPGVIIVDDPGIPRGLASRRVDGEGAPCRRMRFVDDGVLTQWATNAATASQLEVPVTGHGASLGQGVSFSNFYLDAGSISPEMLTSDIDFGLYVTNFLGQGVNLVSGHYSQAVSGFLIESGEITTPVKEATIVGDLSEMFRVLIPANDLELREQFNAPTVRIDGMLVSSA